MCFSYHGIFRTHKASIAKRHLPRCFLMTRMYAHAPLSQPAPVHWEQGTAFNFASQSCLAAQVVKKDHRQGQGPSVPFPPPSYRGLNAKAVDVGSVCESWGWRDRSWFCGGPQCFNITLPIGQEMCFLTFTQST